MSSDRNSSSSTTTMKRSCSSQLEGEGEEVSVAKKHKPSGESSSKRTEKKLKSKSKSKSRSGKEKKHKSKGSKHDEHSKFKFTELSNDDYFAKNNEFATWLKEEKKKFFSDLSTETARELFSEFVKEWNSQELKSKYYKGIDTGPRSSHRWKIKD